MIKFKDDAQFFIPYVVILVPTIACSIEYFVDSIHTNLSEFNLWPLSIIVPVAFVYWNMIYQNSLFRPKN